MKHLKGSQCQRAIEEAVALAERAAQQHRLDARKASIDEVCDGEVCRYHRDVAVRRQAAHELEGSGARVHHKGIAVVNEAGGMTGDCAFGLGVHVDAPVLYGDRDGLGERDRAAVRAPELAVALEGIEVRAGRDG